MRRNVEVKDASVQGKNKKKNPSPSLHGPYTIWNASKGQNNQVTDKLDKTHAARKPCRSEPKSSDSTAKVRNCNTHFHPDLNWNLPIIQPYSRSRRQLLVWRFTKMQDMETPSARAALDLYRISSTSGWRCSKPGVKSFYRLHVIPTFFSSICWDEWIRHAGYDPWCALLCLCCNAFAVHKSCVVFFFSSSKWCHSEDLLESVLHAHTTLKTGHTVL